MSVWTFLGENAAARTCQFMALVNLLLVISPYTYTAIYHTYTYIRNTHTNGLAWWYITVTSVEVGELVIQG